MEVSWPPGSTQKYGIATSKPLRIDAYGFVIETSSSEDCLHVMICPFCVTVDQGRTSTTRPFVATVVHNPRAFLSLSDQHEQCMFWIMGVLCFGSWEYLLKGPV